MKPEDYLATLRHAQSVLDSARFELEKAFSLMQKRLETGYEFYQDESRFFLKNGRDHIDFVNSKLSYLEKSDVDF